MKYWLSFLVGLALGIGGAVLAPRFAGPYLPGLLGPRTSVEGTVVAKQREADRLLLTLRTAEGGILVTFTDKVADIDLLVATEDKLTITMGQYEPFVNNPVIRRVEKFEPGHPVGKQAPGAPARETEGQPTVAPP